MRLSKGIVAGITVLGAGMVAAPVLGQATATEPIMPLAQVQAGMQCTALSVLQGTAISSFDVQVLGVIQQYQQQGPRILVSVSGPAVAATGIAEGFSGSPVLCPSGTGVSETIGAISEGVGQYGNNIALVTPIEAMLGEPVTPPSDVPRVDFQTRPLGGPLTFGGLSPSLMALLQRAAQSAGRQLVAAPVAGAPPAFPVQTLAPGASVATQYSMGAVQEGAIGTVTYLDGPNVYAFGHELDGAGRRSLMLTDAYVYGVINNPNVSQGNTSYKLAVPGHLLGTLTGDTPNAVIGVLGSPPATVPVDIVANDQDTGRTISENTSVADETDIGLPEGSSQTGLIAPLALGQAAIDIYNGPPAAESGRMCLSIGLRELHTPLRLCKRYVGRGGTGTIGLTPPALALDVIGDATSVFGLVDDAGFARLHVTAVHAVIDAARGLHEAQILSASAPTRVRAGGRVEVRLRVQPFQSRPRTIAFPLQIPRGVTGPLHVTIEQLPAAAAEQATGPLSGLPSALTGSLSALLGGSGAAPAPAPQSLSQLRAAIAMIAPWDGLVARFGHTIGPHLYRSPRLLITGEAPLSFDVVARRLTAGIS